MEAMVSTAGSQEHIGVAVFDTPVPLPAPIDARIGNPSATAALWKPKR